MLPHLNFVERCVASRVVKAAFTPVVDRFLVRSSARSSSHVNMSRIFSGAHSGGADGWAVSGCVGLPVAGNGLTVLSQDLISQLNTQPQRKPQSQTSATK